MNISRNKLLKSSLLVAVFTLMILLASCGHSDDPTIPPKTSSGNPTTSSEPTPSDPEPTPSDPKPTPDFAMIVEALRNAAAGECEIGKVQAGTTSPVVVIPEHHTSVIGQIQEAISLVKLYYSNSLKDIVLEGYLKDGPEIDYTNFYRVCGDDERVMRSVAVKLLSEGEISAAEFMKLVFREISIYPTELKKNYNEYKVPDNIDEIINSYLEKIYDEDLEWTENWIDEYLAVIDEVNLEKVLGVMEKLVNYTQDKIELTEDEKSGMQTYIAFLAGRIASSADIAKVASEKSKDIPLSAMIIGAAHSDGILADLSDKSVPYVVLTPLIFNEKMDEEGKFHKSDMDWETFLDKGNNKSVLTMGVAKILDDILKPFVTTDRTESEISSSIKPEPIINRNSIVEARIELCAITASLGRMLGSGDLPLKEAIDEKYFLVNPDTIEIVAEPNNKRSVFFEASLKQYNKSIYVKALLSENDVGEGDMLDELVKMLKRAEDKCKNATGFSKQAEDEDGEIRLDMGESEKVSIFAGLDKNKIRNSVFSE